MVDRTDKPQATIHVLPLANKERAGGARRFSAPSYDPVQEALDRLAEMTARLQARTEQLLDVNARIGDDISEVALGLELHGRVGRILSQTCESLTDLRACVEQCQEVLHGHALERQPGRRRGN